MKKIYLTLAGAVSLMFTSPIFADINVNKNSGYYSSQHPLIGSTATKTASLFPPTDITVTNTSSSLIYLIVPNTPIFDTLQPRSTPDHIRNNMGAYNTTIVLETANQAIFFNQVVCPRALVTVYDDFNGYKINVDNEYCY